MIADEIYDDFLYNLEHLPSIARYEEMDERTVQVHGFSKTYAMTGFRLGYLRGPRALIEQVQRCTNRSRPMRPAFPNTLLWQHCGLTTPVTYRPSVLSIAAASMLCGQRARRTTFPSSTRAAPFFLFVDFRDREPNSVRAAEFVLNSCLVALVPGVAYGARGEGWLRRSLTAPTDQLCEAVRRIKSADFRRSLPE